LLAKLDSTAEFKIQYVSGNKDEIKNLLISGQSPIVYNSNFIVDSEGRNLLNNKSYFEKLNSNYYYNNNIYKLYKNHRSFMRGKTDPYSFYEDKNEVISVFTNPRNNENQQITFEVEILNKKTENVDKKQFTLNKNDLYFFTVADVQKQGNNLLVMFETHKDEVISEQQILNKVDYNLITFDLKQNKIINEEIIFQNSTSKDSYSQISRAEEIDLNAPTPYFIRIEQKYERISGQDGSVTEKEISKKFLIYDYQKKAFIKSPTDVSKYYYESGVLYSDKEIYIQESTGTAQSVVVYDIATGQKLNKVSLKIPNNKNMNFYTIENNKLYSVVSGLSENGYGDYDLSVTDVKTGETLYKGLIENNNNIILGRVFLK
jgi:hypothetical protein